MYIMKKSFTFLNYLYLTDQTQTYLTPSGIVFFYIPLQFSLTLWSLNHNFLLENLEHFFFFFNLIVQFIEVFQENKYSTADMEVLKAQKVYLY